MSFCGATVTANKLANLPTLQSLQSRSRQQPEAPSAAATSPRPRPLQQAAAGCCRTGAAHDAATAQRATPVTDRCGQLARTGLAPAAAMSSAAAEPEPEPEPEPPEPEPEPEPLTPRQAPPRVQWYYALLQPCVVRCDAAMDSALAPANPLAPPLRLLALGTATVLAPDGSARQRVQFEQGWVSAVGGDGSLVLLKEEEEAGAAAAAAIEAGGARLTRLIGKGAEQIGAAAKEGAATYKRTTARLEPEVVDPAAAERLAAARDASAKGLAASQTALSGVASGVKMATSTLSMFSSKKKAKGKKAEQLQHPLQPATRVSAAMAVAGASAGAAVEVLFSLRAAASSVSADLADATVDAVSHRYGDDAGATTRDGLEVFQNVGKSAFNVSQMVVSAADIVTDLATSRSSRVSEWLSGPALLEGRWLLRIVGAVDLLKGKKASSTTVSVNLRPNAIVINMGEGAVPSVEDLAAGDTEAAATRLQKLRFIPLEDIRDPPGSDLNTRAGGSDAGDVGLHHPGRGRLLEGGQRIEVRTRDDCIYQFQVAVDLDAQLATAHGSDRILGALDNAEDIEGWTDAIDAAVRARKMAVAEELAVKAKAKAKARPAHPKPPEPGSALANLQVVPSSKPVELEGGLTQI